MKYRVDTDMYNADMSGKIWDLVGLALGDAQGMVGVPLEMGE